MPITVDEAVLVWAAVGAVPVEAVMVHVLAEAKVEDRQVKMPQLANGGVNVGIKVADPTLVFDPVTVHPAL